jgi:hypothetical protein
MLRATKSFTTRYDGELIEVKAGATFIDADHELARSHPECFEQDPAEVKQAAAAASNGHRTRSRSGGTPRRRLTAEQETEIRAARIREIEQRAADGWQDGEAPAGGLSRALGPETREERIEAAWWRAIHDMLFGDERREAAASTEFFDELKAIETRRLASERESLSDWLDEPQ